jgi:hypothetical protein
MSGKPYPGPPPVDVLTQVEKCKIVIGIEEVFISHLISEITKERGDVRFLPNPRNHTLRA